MRFAACQLWSVSNAVCRALSWYPGLAPRRLQPCRQLSNGTAANLPHIRYEYNAASLDGIGITAMCRLTWTGSTALCALAGRQVCELYCSWRQRRKYWAGTTKGRPLDSPSAVLWTPIIGRVAQLAEQLTLNQ